MMILLSRRSIGRQQVRLNRQGPAAWLQNSWPPLYDDVFVLNIEKISSVCIVGFHVFQWKFLDLFSDGHLVGFF